MTLKVWIGTEDSLHAHAAKYAAIREHAGPIELLRHIVAPKKPAAVKAGSCDDEDDDYPNPVDYQLAGNTAVITVTGGTENRTTWWTRYCGIPTYQDIRDRMIQAYDDQAVKSVLLSLGTPGGYAEGAFGLAEFITMYNKNIKPVVSYTDTSVASAGVLYGTAASALFADKYAMVGSIGAVIMFMDMSGYYKEMKIIPTVFRSAPYKAVPNAYEGLTKEGTEILQERVDMWHGRFVEQLSANLSLDAAAINKNIANGKMFDAEVAVSLGLAQGITTFEKLVATMNTKYQNINASAARPV